MTMKFKPGLLLHKDPARNRPVYLANPLGEAIVTPPQIDRRDEMLPSSDQGDTSQCAAFAVAGCAEWYRWKHLGIEEQVDPAPIYKRAKELDGFPAEDGTTLEAAVQAAVDLKLMPIDMASLRRVYVTDYERAIHHHDIVLAGFDITSGWSKARPDGWIVDEGGISLGGHAVVLVGYNKEEDPQWVGLQNSWGEAGYGWRGFCRLDVGQFRREFQYGVVWDYLL